jgi:hypothetical protein
VLVEIAVELTSTQPSEVLAVVKMVHHHQTVHQTEQQEKEMLAETVEVSVTLHVEEAAAAVLVQLAEMVAALLAVLAVQEAHHQ